MDNGEKRRIPLENFLPTNGSELGLLRKGVGSHPS